MSYYRINISESLAEKIGHSVDEDWILVGGEDSGGTEGAIATVQMFESFSLNPCHLYENGEIRAFGNVIGTAEDIES